MLRKLATAAAIVTALALPASSAARPSATATSCTGAVSWSRAARYIGQERTVTGPVAGTFYSAAVNGAPTFLNLGRDYPRQGFVVVIWGNHRAQFGAPERQYRGRTICVRGVISTYRGVPQMEARSPSQIVSR
jgi:DNA/RNA endonuclease YhcR with UshA esterase domain